MHAIVYVSEATAPFDEDALAELAARAAADNERLGVTGYLHYRRERRVFFQYIEGEIATLHALMGRIAADPRHEIANTLELGDVGPRRFPGWSMRSLSSAELRSIRLEDVLESVLLTMRRPAFSPEETRPTVLRIVHQLALRDLV